MLDTFFDEIAVPDFFKTEFTAKDWYTVIGKLKGILSHKVTSSELLSKADTLIVHGNVHIGSDCVVGENVVIEGPVYIGNNVEIGPGAFIRAGSVIGNNCVIGHAAEIKNAILMDGAKISNHSFVGDSIIGVKARVGGHCETTNRRFDQGAISFVYQDQKLETGLDKLGLILGEEARLGGDVMTAPGTMIGKKTFVATSLSIGGYLPPHKYVKKRLDYDIVDNLFEGGLNSDSHLYN